MTVPMFGCINDPCDLMCGTPECPFYETEEEIKAREEKERKELVIKWGVPILEAIKLQRAEDERKSKEISANIDAMVYALAKKMDNDIIEALSAAGN